MPTSIPKPRTTSVVSSGHNAATINVPLGSRVVLTRRRSGSVRYIGKLKNEVGEWYGIALDEGKGDSDGSHEKERYFECAAHHGVFVRRKEIFCVKESPVRTKCGPPSPVTQDNSDAGSSTSSNADSHDTVAQLPSPLPLSSSPNTVVATVAPPAPTPKATITSHISITQQASAVITPLVRTFKSFRKDLGLQISPTKAASNNNNHSSSSSSSRSGSDSHAASSPKAQPTASSSPASAATRSSGLRSPSSNRFASYSSPPSPVRRTASIVSQMVVTPLETPPSSQILTPTPSHILTLSKPIERVPSFEFPVRSEQDELATPTPTITQYDSSLEPSVGVDFFDDCSGISSLSDLYRDVSFEAQQVEVTASSRSELTPTTSSRIEPMAATMSPPIASSKIEPIAAPPSSTSSTSPVAATASSRTEVTTSSRTESIAAPTSSLSTSPLRTSPTKAVPVLTRVSSFSSSTVVESIRSPARTAEPAPAPLFFRRAHVGAPAPSRRASFTNGNRAMSASSAQASDKANLTESAATARMVELEKEISAMKTSHENVVAVLRATNKQHAANVLELRAQVEALTEGHHWLEKQLAAKSALITELRELERSGARVPRSEVESIIAIKDAQIQTLEREVAKLKQQVLRIETEKDSVLCQQARHARWRHESDEARIAKLREDVRTMCNERSSLQSELQDLKEMTFLF